jgi:Cation transporter/ATPase, N-terminus.
MEEIEHTLPIEQLLERLGVEKVTFGISDHILMQRLASDGYNLPAKEKLRASVLIVLHENLMFILYCMIFTSVLIAIVDFGPSCSLSHILIICFTFVA